MVLNIYWTQYPLHLYQEGISDSHLDLIRAPYILYGVKYIDLVSLVFLRICRRDRHMRDERDRHMRDERDEHDEMRREEERDEHDEMRREEEHAARIKRYAASAPLSAASAPLYAQGCDVTIRPWL